DLVGGPGSNVSVHGHRHVLGHGPRFHHRAGALDGVALGKAAGPGGAAVVVNRQQALFVGVDAGGGLDQAALRTLADRDDDAGVGVEGLAALHLDKAAVRLLDGVAADQAVVPDLHRGLAEAEAHPLQLGVADFVLGG